MTWVNVMWDLEKKFPCRRELSSCFARRTLLTHPTLHITLYTLIHGDVASSGVKELIFIDRNTLISIILHTELPGLANSCFLKIE